MKVICVIPARYASTRLPGKPLKLIAGKPMIRRVYEQAKKAKMPKKTNYLILSKYVSPFSVENTTAPSTAYG